MQKGKAQPIAEISAKLLQRRLKDLLAQKGWKPANLAEKAGMSAGWLPELIRGGVNKPQRRTLEKIARAFDMTVDELLADLPTEEVVVPLTKYEADMLRSIAAIERTAPEEIASDALGAFLREQPPAVRHVVAAIRRARSDNLEG